MKNSKQFVSAWNNSKSIGITDLRFAFFTPTLCNALTHSLQRIDSTFVSSRT